VVDRYKLTPARISELFDGLVKAQRVEPRSTLPVEVRDAKDERIVASGLGGGADYLVTGNKDLLVLQGDQRLGKLKIVTVAEFLTILIKWEQQQRNTPS
jgi:predicted nucleic acid-binding protein